MAPPRNIKDRNTSELVNLTIIRHQRVTDLTQTDGWVNTDRRRKLIRALELLSEALQEVDARQVVGRQMEVA